MFYLKRGCSDAIAGRQSSRGPSDRRRAGAAGTVNRSAASAPPKKKQKCVLGRVHAASCMLTTQFTSVNIYMQRSWFARKKRALQEDD